MRLPKHITRRDEGISTYLKCTKCEAECGFHVDNKELKKQWMKQFVEAHRKCKGKGQFVCEEGVCKVL